MGGVVPGVEHPQRLQRLFLVRACRVLGARRLHGGAGDGRFRPDAVADDPVLCSCRESCRRTDRLPDLPPARALLRAGDARLSAGDALRLRLARVPGGHPADEARVGVALHAVRRPADLRRAGARPGGGIALHLAQGREFADGHGAPGDQAERAGGRGGGDRHLALEDAGLDAVGRLGRGGRRVLRGRPPGGDARDRVRHAGVGPGLDPRPLRRGREPLGPGHRRDGAGAARRGAQRRTG